MTKKFSLFLVCCMFFAAAARAEGPVEISAAKSLEWNRSAKTYTAKEDVVAKKGEAEIRSDRMTAFYSDAKGGTDVSKMEAAGNVVVSSPPYKAYGDKGVYDVKTGNAVLTGQNLKIETGDERLTARDKIEYSDAAKSLTALGEAVAVKNAQTLKADTLTAFFVKGADGKMTTDKITASGHIVLTTEKEKIYGEAGVYDVPAQKAQLTGGVKIYQGESFLEGDRATVDMRTGVSQLFADGDRSSEGRVRGVFYPKKQEQKTQEQQP